MGETGLEHLLTGLIAGRESAFAALCELMGPRLYRTARTLLGNAQDAEDAVQEVFVSLVRGRARLTNVDNLSAYLFASLRNAAARIAKRRADAQARLIESTASVEPVGPGRSLGETRETDLHDRRRSWLRQALDRLPAEQREIVALKIDGELTFAQIGVLLKISPQTAASRYRYALEKLKAAVTSETRFHDG